MNKENRICALCKLPITHKKGQARSAYKFELQNDVHVQCQRVHNEILEKYHLSQNAYASAVFDGLFELFPELRETKAVNDFESRKKKAEEEIENNFPYLKKEEKKSGV